MRSFWSSIVAGEAGDTDGAHDESAMTWPTRMHSTNRVITVDGVQR